MRGARPEEPDDRNHHGRTLVEGLAGKKEWKRAYRVTIR
jgi:hypothetical protein